MKKKIVMEPYVDYDGILTQDERRKILTRVESAFARLGATIPEEIEIEGVKFRLQEEIESLVLKEKLSPSENKRIKKLIFVLEDHSKLLKSIVRTGDISESDAMDISEKICGVLRAVHELRELVRSGPKSDSIDAKQELIKNIEDKKRWLKYLEKIQ
jgi:hypothetical protein